MYNNRLASGELLLNDRQASNSQVGGGGVSAGGGGVELWVGEGRLTRGGGGGGDWGAQTFMIKNRPSHNKFFSKQFWWIAFLETIEA